MFVTYLDDKRRGQTDRHKGDNSRTEPRLIATVASVLLVNSCNTLSSRRPTQQVALKYKHSKPTEKKIS